MYVFIGKKIPIVREGIGHCYYSTQTDDGSGCHLPNMGRLCGERASRCWGGYRHGNICTWGYTGNGPHRTSAHLLAVTLFGWDAIMCAGVWHYHYGSAPILTYTDYHKVTVAIAPYVEDFTKEFTSKWGDSWTITSDEVRVWLKSKGYQEAKKREEVVA